MDYSDDFFGRPANLTVSGQLEGELAAMALRGNLHIQDNVRAENFQRHTTPFIRVLDDWAGSGFLRNRGKHAAGTGIYQYCVKWALDNCQDDLNFLNEMYDKELIERLKFVVENDFIRLTYTEGIKILEQAVANGHKFEYRVGWGTDLNPNTSAIWLNSISRNRSSWPIIRRK